MWWLFPALLAGGVIVARRRGGGAPGKGGFLRGLIKKHDGSSKDDPMIITLGNVAPNSLQGKWYALTDGSGPWLAPTQDQLQAFGKSVVDAALHNRSLPLVPDAWGPALGAGGHWKNTTVKVAAPIASAVGAGIGFITGGPAGAKAGWQTGGALARKIWV